MNIYVPVYNENGFKFVWEDGFSIKCSINDSVVSIEANKEGLVSLARHMLELAQENVPEFEHFHLDKCNSLEDDSVELIIVRKNM
mgnify:CR=1 FL=1